jgi:hypothetical protein
VYWKTPDFDPLAFFPTGFQPRRPGFEKAFSVQTIGSENRHVILKLPDQLFGQTLDQPFGPADGRVIALNHMENFHSDFEF